MLLALRNSAAWIADGKTVSVEGEKLMGEAKPYVTGYPGFNFCAYPNRDSTGYAERYKYSVSILLVQNLIF